MLYGTQYQQFDKKSVTVTIDKDLNQYISIFSYGSCVFFNIPTGKLLIEICGADFTLCEIIVELPCMKVEWVRDAKCGTHKLYRFIMQLLHSISFCTVQHLEHLRLIKEQAVISPIAEGVQHSDDYVVMIQSSLEKPSSVKAEHVNIRCIICAIGIFEVADGN